MAEEKRKEYSDSMRYDKGYKELEKILDELERKVTEGELVKKSVDLKFPVSVYMDLVEDKIWELIASSDFSDVDVPCAWLIKPRRRTGKSFVYCGMKTVKGVCDMVADECIIYSPNIRTASNVERTLKKHDWVFW